MNTSLIRHSNRIPVQPNELIDRTHPVTFKFNGKAIQAYRGDSIASALAANGVKIIGRSFKYHRPRGLFAYGHEMNSMVQIGNEVSVSAWLRKVEEGLEVRSVNAWPSPERDILSLTQFGDRFLPVGFYYKTFIHPAFMWPTYENVLRNIAGLGRVDITAALESGYDKQYLHYDIVVVGSDPAGLQAALRASKVADVRVALFTEEETLGGPLRYDPTGADTLTDLIHALAERPNVNIYTETDVFCWFEENWLGAVKGERLYKIRAEAVIMATGANDQPLIFEKNDLPGVMLGSGVRRMLHLYGVIPGQKVLVVTGNDDGWQVAADLAAAGVTVMGVADIRSDTDSDLSNAVERMGVPAFWRHSIVKAKGSHAVSGAIIAPVDAASGQPNLDAGKEIGCDLISVSIGWAPDNGLIYQAGAKIAYDEARHEFLAQHYPASLFAAGRVTGAHSLELELEEGELVGQQALAAIGQGRNPAKSRLNALATKKGAAPIRTHPFFAVAGKGKRFVDRDEDVTTDDIETAIAEGYNSIELLKRYSTIGMGPSQGRWANLNAIHLTAQENGWSIAETGTTTSRPPTRPVEMGALAGQMMEPVKYTPLHDWHMQQGAKMMGAGLWMRPEHYGDPAAEVKAVRERVGLIDISTLGKLKLTGPGVPDFLNKLYVNRWSKLKEGRVRYGIMCNSEGIIMDDGVTARVGPEEWYTTTTSGGAGQIYEWVQWWRQSGWGEGVTVTNVTDGNAAFNLAGPLSRATLTKLLEPDQENALDKENFNYMDVRELTLAGVDCRLMFIGFTGELSYEIHCPAGYAQYLWQAILDAGAEHGISSFGVEAQRILRLEKGHIIIGQDTDALTDPLMVGMDRLVKLDKPDFLGQRMLQRTAENGVHQKLVGFKLDRRLGWDHSPSEQHEAPEEGLQIVLTVPRSEKHPRGLKIIGWVTSSRFSPTLNEVIGLCWLPTEVAESEGASFNIRRNNSLIPAVVHHGPFVDPEDQRLKR